MTGVDFGSGRSLDDVTDAMASAFSVAHTADSPEDLARALVYNAGRFAWRLRELGVASARTAKQKTSFSDIVTAADSAAERFTTLVLHTLRPQDGVVGEESTCVPSISGLTWVIDPVDGTYNFAHHSDYWCSALALVESTPEKITSSDYPAIITPDCVVVGAVHRPEMGYTWIGGRDIPTKKIVDGTTHTLKPLKDLPLGHSCLATYLDPKYTSPDAAPCVATTWAAVACRMATVRMNGSGSLDFAALAEGEESAVHAWMQHSVPAWDWLPGQGLLAGVQGHSAHIRAGDVTWFVAGSQRTVDDLQEIIREHHAA